MGGTCAVDLTVMHPDTFSTFEDIAGDMAPNSGTKQQTIDRLFSGNATQYSAFDPATVIAKHGGYEGISGWFEINGTTSSPPPPTAVNAANNGANVLGGRDAAGRTSDQTAAANALCGLAAADGIECAVVAQPGKHDWPFAAHAFAAALPWLAGRIGTPDVPPQPFPVPPAPAGPTLQAAAK
jgi:S-formylglutathione hydrolase FrmB